MCPPSLLPHSLPPSFSPGGPCLTHCDGAQAAGVIFSRKGNEVCGLGRAGLGGATLQQERGVSVPGPDELEVPQPVEDEIGTIQGGDVGVPKHPGWKEGEITWHGRPGKDLRSPMPSRPIQGWETLREYRTIPRGPLALLWPRPNSHHYLRPPTPSPVPCKKPSAAHRTISPSWSQPCPRKLAIPPPLLHLSPAGPQQPHRAVGADTRHSRCVAAFAGRGHRRMAGRSSGSTSSAALVPGLWRRAARCRESGDLQSPARRFGGAGNFFFF